MDELDGSLASDPGETASSLLDDFPDALILVNPEGRVTFWSGGAERMFGYSRGEIVGRRLVEALAPQEHSAELEAWTRVLASDGGAVYETVRRRKDGTTIVVDASVRAVRGPDGKVKHLAITKKDVTRLKYLRESEVLKARFKGLLDAAPDAMVIVNRDGRVVLANDQTEKLFGYPQSEVIGEPVELFVPDPFRAGHPAHRKLYFAEPRPRSMGAGADLAGRRRDGSEFPAEISLSPIKTEDGSVLVAAAIRDVSGRKKIEARFKGLLEAAPDAMVVVRRDGRIVLVNGETERLFGYTRGELIGQLVDVLVPERFRENHPEKRTGYFIDPRRRPMGEGIELAARRKDGSEFPAEISLSPVETEDELLVTAAVRDVTERKRMEQRKAEELAEQHRRIQEANRLKSEFLANMSHELRTPLNAIIGFAKLMHTGTVGPVSDDHREYLGDILTSAHHLLQLINDVLDLSKVEAGKMEFSPEPIDLGQTVREAAETLRTLSVQKQIRLEASVEPEVAHVVVDPQRLKQILYNYLSNAIKFTPEGGRVIVRARPEGADRFRLEVEDTGVGIEPGDIERLFVEFQQLDASSAKKHQGTGLGLALTRRLARAQHGEVGVSSAPGQGSTFWVVLPRDARVAATGPRRKDSSVTAGPDAARTVLVIEDDPRDRAWIERTIASAGYPVVAAFNGREALELCRERRFGAITLDLILPDLSGWDILHAIRERGPNRETPVIVTTVVGEASAAFPVLDYLKKPLRAEELAAALARAGLDAGKTRPVLVLDDEPANLRLAELALEKAGLQARCRSDPEAALREATDDPPAAIVLDLLMPELDGFEFLRRFRETPAGRVTPVIVWTVKDLSTGERARLRTSAQGVVLKNEGGADALLRELRAHLPDGARAAGGAS